MTNKRSLELVFEDTDSTYEDFCDFLQHAINHPDYQEYIKDELFYFIEWRNDLNNVDYLNLNEFEISFGLIDAYYRYLY